MVCPFCGYGALPDAARFCPNCGEPITQSGRAAATTTVNQQIQNMQNGQAVGVEIGHLSGNIIIAADEEAQAQRRRNLRILLSKVQHFWIGGVLERSLAGAVFIELDKQYSPEIVEQPLDAISPIPDRQAQDVPHDKTVAQIFDENDHALLIVDGIGSGKTTALLELARDTIAQAERDPTQPIPVVLNLSSWTVAKSIADWAVDELSNKYQIPRALGRAWLDGNYIALLLDGLDEVSANRRTACIAAVNQFRREHGLIRISVCSRSQEYQEVGLKLSLAAAILLQPLSKPQIAEYLAGAGPGITDLNESLRADTTLQSLASSPLMLRIMCQAFKDAGVDEIHDNESESPAERRALIVKAYVERAYGQMAGHEFQSRQANDRWLSWLARGMTLHGQSIFLIEQLQPAWLSSNAELWLYWLVSRAFVGLCVGIVLGGTAEVGAGSLEGRGAYVIASILAGLCVGLFDGIRLARTSGLATTPLRDRLRRTVYTLSVGCVAALWFYVLFSLGSLPWTERWRLAGGAFLVYALVFGITATTGQADIQTAEAIAWSWNEARNGLLPGFLLAGGTALGVWLLYGGSSALDVWLPFALTYAGLAAGALVLVFGLRGRQVERRTYPNQGIWLSARNAIRVGVAVGVVAGLVYGYYGIVAGSVVGFRIGLLFLLLYGGFAVVKHTTLRIILASKRHVPLNLTAFLENAVQIGFLQRVGGGYVFVNRLLQEYFFGLVP